MLKLWFQVLLGIVIVAYSIPAEAAGLREQQILDLVRDEAVARLQVPRRDVEVQWRDVAIDSLIPALPEGQVTLEIAKTARLGGRGNIPVQISVDGRKFRTIFPRLEVRIYQKVLVARTRLVRGTIAGSRMSDSSDSQSRGATKIPADADRYSSRSRSHPRYPGGGGADSPNVQASQVIKLGDIVNVIYQDGDLTLIYTAQARSAGAVGQLIRVMNIESKKEFTARITGPNRVEIKQEVGMKKTSSLFCTMALLIVAIGSPAQADSLYTEGPNDNLTGFTRPYLGIGNLVTVALSENNTAESGANTDRSKDARSPAANPGGATVGQPQAAPVTTPVASTSGTAWLVWLVCGVVAVALLGAGGWALTRNRAPRSDLQPAATPAGPDGAGSGPQPETAGQAVGRPEGRTGQGEDTP